MAVITLFDPWKSKLCSCPTKYSLSPYTGCEHGCLYCYASSYIPQFFIARPKKHFLSRLKKELEALPKNSFITIANSSDPYQPLEKKMELMRSVLKILKNFDLHVMIITKSDLILRDLDLLVEQKNLVVAFTITTLDSEISQRIEPRAPSPDSRLKAIEKVSKYLPVVVRFDPLIYPLNTEDIENTLYIIKEKGARQVITSTYKAKVDNLRRMSEAFPEYKQLWENLYLRKGETRGRYYYLPVDLRKSLIEKVRKVSLYYGLEFSSCREGFSNLNTLSCDGSSFFKR